MNILKLSGADLRQMRESLNWTRDYLSEKSEVPTRTIADIELGTVKNPGLETIKKMIGAMDPDFGKETEKAESILAIIAALPTLNELELRAINTRIRDFLIKRPRSRSSAV